MKIKYIIKAFFVVVLCMISEIIETAVRPIINNSLAMSQMQNSVDSSAWIQVYNVMYNYRFIVIIGVFLLLFHKELNWVIQKIKKYSTEME